MVFNSKASKGFLTALLFLIVSSTITSVTAVHLGFRGLVKRSSDHDFVSRELLRKDDETEDEDEVHGNMFLFRRRYCVPDRMFGNNNSYHTERARGLGALLLLLRGSVLGACPLVCMSLCNTYNENRCYADPGVDSWSIDTCVCEEEEDEANYLCVEHAECVNDQYCACIEGYYGDGTEECVARSEIVDATEALITFRTGTESNMSSEMTPRITLYSEQAGGGYQATDHIITSQLPDLGETRSYTVSAYPNLAKIRISAYSNDPNNQDEWFFDYLHITFGVDGLSQQIDLTDRNTGKVGVWLDGQPYNSVPTYSNRRYQDNWIFNIV